MNQTFESVDAHVHSVDLDHIQRSMASGVDKDTTLGSLYQAVRPIITLVVMGSFLLPAKWRAIVTAFVAEMDTRFLPAGVA